MDLELNHRAPTGIAVTHDFFGANLLFKRNELTDESGGDSSFVRAVEALGVTALRYPGGSMTENWGADFYTDPDTRPAHLLDTDMFTGLSEFLAYTAANGMEATIVLPTAHLLLGTPDGNTTRALDPAALGELKAFIISLMSGLPDIDPDAVIAAFEIGNEYWSDHVDMTSAEYGLVANAVAITVQEALDEVLGAGSEQPEILVQMGNSWGPDFDAGGTYGAANLTWGEQIDTANADILDGLTHDAFVAIDGLIEHYYYGDSDPELTIGEDSASWRDLDLYSINRDLDMWRSVWAMGGYGDISLAVTEWGIGAGNTEQYGLKGASVILEMLEAMLRIGVNSATAWPVELGGPWDLAGSNDGSDGAEIDALTPFGAAFSLMALNTIGTELLDNGFTGADAAQELVEVNSFGSDEKFVFFLSSRSENTQDVTLDVSSYVTDYASVSGALVTLADQTDALNDPGSFAEIVTLNGANVARGTLIDVTLQPYEIVMVTYTLHSAQSIEGTNASNELRGGRGNDDIRGEGGNDTLIGERGDDTLAGGAGDDALQGWGGHDALYGDAGNDGLYGGQGVDMLSGGLGDDTLDGGLGDDVLRAGSGDDRLLGGEGADILIAGFGDDRLIGGADDDLLSGGLGADVFVFAGADGSDILLDFERGEDVIDLSGVAGIGALSDLSFAEATREMPNGESVAGVLVGYGSGEVLVVTPGSANFTVDDFIF